MLKTKNNIVKAAVIPLTVGALLFGGMASPIGISKVEASAENAVKTLFYTKTITVRYDSTNFPATTTYSEYNDEYKAFYEGELRFISSIKSKGKYEATYTGRIYKKQK